MKSRLLPISTLIVTSLFAIPGAWPHGQEGREAVNILQQQLPSNAPGKKAVMLTVSYAPGQKSVPHQHPGAVMAYVLEGTVISQLKGEQPATYKAGDYWYEPPGSVHLMSSNASQTRPAKLLVWSLVDEQLPVTEPYHQ
ncbi:cupin domain-containing protein [Pseudomonas rubra]|uniref:Cupin domain-containing protein n=1 Tax=Pseudomonas rubra TaxID=2942627 RepID=A0ABT5PE72_9PSED|nr:cupin domain-containing protein [Pseudomonas rubra]MDD1016614.1 cupin domain-containing protein [Pseudomonas rubra]MDD1039411.1 cupin domain-containing protein [Pseudomonas rubra]MDD1154856.1 cupin domain-containing protein [Pseudomonas rubra]